MKWNEVTWYSRLGALVLFLGVVPILSFYIGMKYQAVQPLENPDASNETDITDVDTLNIFTKDHAIRRAKEAGVRFGSDGYYPLERITFEEARLSGSGMAWFIYDEGPKTDKDDCPSRMTSRRLSLEMNAESGVVMIERECYVVIFD